MLSGRRAFPGEGQELRSAIVLREPAPLVGVPTCLARLVDRCLAKAPAQRWQRIQNVQMELKLLTVMARREEHVEESQSERLQAILRKDVAPAVETLTARVSSIENATFEIRTKLAEESERWLAASQAVRELRQDIATLSRQMEEVDREHKASAAITADEAASLARRLDGLDRMLEAQGSSVESLNSAVTQTDDLVEHLVDEVDALARYWVGRKKGPVAMAALSS
jgi:hypothetical protein